MVSVEERLATIEANTLRILKFLDGNGQPGLVTRIAKIEEKLVVVESEAAAKNRNGLVGGVTGSAATASLFSAAAIILQKLGVIQV